MAVKCKIIKGKEICPKPNLFMVSYLGQGMYDPFSPEARLFIDAVLAAGGLLSAAEANAIDEYVIDAQTNANAWWDETMADYPFVGSSMAAHQINLKTPGTFDLIFVNTVAGDHTSTGWTPNGTDSYGRAGIVLSTELATNNFHAEYYSRDDVTADVSCMGVQQLATQRTEFHIERVAGETLFECFDNVGRIFVDDPDIENTAAGFMVGRQGNDLKVFLRGVKVIEVTDASIEDKPSIELYLGASNRSPAAAFETRETAGAGFFDDLSEAQVLAQYTARQTLNTALGRQV